MTASKQQNVTLEELNQTIWNHMEVRDWHNSPPRSIAISLSLEANELLEHYQWGDDPAGGKEGIGDELADIFIYAIQFAQINDIDIAHHIERKLARSNKKYPPENFKGKDTTQIREKWLENKLSYKEGEKQQL